MKIIEFKFGGDISKNKNKNKNKINQNMTYNDMYTYTNL